ncbi:hypothetical protein VPH35_131845 [Triticum aestivum]
MEQRPDGTTMGALGLAGICRETFAVIRSRRPGFSSMAGEVIGLSLSRLAHVAISRALLSHAAAASDAGAGFAACIFCIVLMSLRSASSFVFSTAPRYGYTDGRDARSITRELRAVPRFLARELVSTSRGDSRRAARIFNGWRLMVTTFDAFLLLLGYTVLFGAAAWLAHHHLLAAATPGEEISRRTSGAGDDWGFRGMHMSNELFAGKFWAAAPVFWMLDGCVVAVQLAFAALVVDDMMGIGVWLRVAAGVVMAAALWLAVMAGLVAQVEVYLVCKSCHRQRESLHVTEAKKYLANVVRERATPTATATATRKRRQ